MMHDQKNIKLRFILFIFVTLCSANVIFKAKKKTFFLFLYFPLGRFSGSVTVPKLEYGRAD